MPSVPGVSTTVRAADLTRLAAAGGLALFLALALEHLLWVVAYPLALIFGGIVIAQGLAPVVTWLTRWLPRPVAVVGLYLTLLALVGGAVWFFSPVLVAQLEQFSDDLPSLQSNLRTLVTPWTPIPFDDVLAGARGYLNGFTVALVDLPVTLVAAAANVTLVFFLSLYWLIAQPALRGWFLGLIPDERRDRTRDMLTEIGETVGGYVRGVLLSALSVGLLTYLGLRVIGMPSALLLAALAGTGELVPILGPFLAAAPALAVAMVTDAVNPLVVAAFYVGLQQVESNILIPVIMRGQASIPPLLSLMAFLIGAAVGGAIGALIAIPLFGVLRIVAVRLLVPAERKLVGVSRAEADAVHREELARETEADA